MPVFTRDETSLLFVHVPKAGGTSVEFAFRNAGWTLSYFDGKAKRKSPNWYRRASPQHMHADVLRATFRLERFDAIFMTVREPLARFRSEYVMRRPGGAGLDAASVEEWARKRLTTYQADPYIHDNHLRPQNEFYLPGVRVYRLEDGLEAMVSDLNQSLDLDLPPEVPHEMEGGRNGEFSSRDVQLSERLTTTLTTFYAADYERFSYPRPPA